MTKDFQIGCLGLSVELLSVELLEDAGHRRLEVVEIGPGMGSRGTEHRVRALPIQSAQRRIPPMSIPPIRIAAPSRNIGIPIGRIIIRGAGEATVRGIFGIDALPIRGVIGPGAPRGR